MNLNYAVDPNNFPPRELIFNKDQHVGVLAWFETSHAMSFKTYDMVIDTDNEVLILDNGVAYPLDTLQERFWTISGSVKWDGCINWETNEECMMHGCGPSHVEELSVLFRIVFALAAKHFPFINEQENEPVKLPDDCMVVGGIT